MSISTTSAIAIQIETISDVLSRLGLEFIESSGMKVFPQYISEGAPPTVWKSYAFPTGRSCPCIPIVFDERDFWELRSDKEVEKLFSLKINEALTQVRKVLYRA